MKKLKNIFEELIDEEYNHKEYLKWKRKNVTIRGVSNESRVNGGSAMLGVGLYTAPLGNRALAKEYGKVYFILNAIPKKPFVVDSLNNWEVWSQNNLFMLHSNDRFPNQREFYKNTTIEAEMIKMGYDGVIIKGREMVNYTPPDNIIYFKTERELQSYYETLLSEDLTYSQTSTEGVEDDEYEIGKILPKV